MLTALKRVTAWVLGYPENVVRKTGANLDEALRKAARDLRLYGHGGKPERLGPGDYAWPWAGQVMRVVVREVTR
jgi:hypothetical protein